MMAWRVSIDDKGTGGSDLRDVRNPRASLTVRKWCSSGHSHDFEYLTQPSYRDGGRYEWLVISISRACFTERRVLTTHPLKKPAVTRRGRLEDRVGKHPVRGSIEGNPLDPSVDPRSA